MSKLLQLEKALNLCKSHPKLFKYDNGPLALIIEGYGTIPKDPKRLFNLSETFIPDIIWDMEKKLLKIKS